LFCFIKIKTIGLLNFEIFKYRFFLGGGAIDLCKDKQIYKEFVNTGVQISP